MHVYNQTKLLKSKQLKSTIKMNANKFFTFYVLLPNKTKPE